MTTGRLLDYQLYVQRDNYFYHESYKNETEFLDLIKQGDVEQIKENKRRIDTELSLNLSAKDLLSDDPIHNQIYYLIVCASIVSRVCISSGLSHETAYTIFNLYVRRADKAESVDDVRRLNYEMVLDFASQMKKMKSSEIFSNSIKMSINYICDNLHNKITTSDLAAYTGYNRSYLSVLFKRETGLTIQDYIFNKRIETAKNLLSQTEYTCAEISRTLCFASQSYFCMQFKKATGITPKQYRLKYRSR